MRKFTHCEKTEYVRSNLVLTNAYEYFMLLFHKTLKNKLNERNKPGVGIT